MSLPFPRLMGTVLPPGHRPGPLSVKFLKEVFICERPAVHNGIQNEVDCHHHETDQAEWQEGFEMLPEILQAGTHGGLGRQQSPASAILIWQQKLKKKKIKREGEGGKGVRWSF